MPDPEVLPVLRRHAHELPTPSYVYFIDRMAGRVAQLKQAFAGRFEISYAAKANPNGAVLRSLRAAGCALDVSSAAEIERGLRAGFAASAISFSGPAKRDVELQWAIALCCGQVVCESEGEIQRLQTLARAANARVPVLLRINPERVPEKFGMRLAGRASQFGVDAELAGAAIEKIAESPQLELEGFHIHSGLNSLHEEGIAENFAIFAELFQRLASEHRLRPKVLIFGSGFGITSPPAPWSDRDKQFCKAMINGGAMDYAAPQYYDGPGLANPDYIVSNVEEWIRDVAAGDAKKIVVGFGMENLPNYSTIDQIKTAWNRIETAHPDIRGAFLWQHKTDSDRGWAFANQIIPLIGPGATTPPVVPPPVTEVEGNKVTIGTASYPLAGTDIARQADALVVYTSKTGAATTTNQWGAEAPVVGGKVNSVSDRQSTGGPGVPIPKDGYVLSGHGKAREWLLAEAQTGDAVTGDVPKTVEPVSPFFAPAGCTLDQLREKHNALVKHLGL